MLLKTIVTSLRSAWRNIALRNKRNHFILTYITMRTHTTWYEKYRRLFIAMLISITLGTSVAAAIYWKKSEDLGVFVKKLQIELKQRNEIIRILTSKVEVLQAELDDLLIKISELKVKLDWTNRELEKSKVESTRLRFIRDSLEGVQKTLIKEKSRLDGDKTRYKELFAISNVAFRADEVKATVSLR